MPKSIFSPEYRRMIERLKRARTAAGLSQEHVAKAMRWGQSAVSKVERCERRLDPIELRKLAKLYKTSLSSLIGD